MIKKITLPIFFVFSIYSLYGQKDTVIYANDNNTIVKEKGQIKNGKKIGVWKEFYTDEENKGLIKREHFYNSRGFSYKVKNYYDKNCNNIISGIGNYKEENGFSVSHGKTIHYYCNGNIEYISFYRNGSSLYSKSYYENGNIKGMQKHIIDTGGERRGKWIRGYENGNIKEKVF